MIMYRLHISPNTRANTTAKQRLEYIEEEEDAVSVKFGRRFNRGDPNKNNVLFSKQVSFRPIIMYESDDFERGGLGAGGKLIGGGKLKAKRLQAALLAAAALTQDTNST